MNRKLLQLEQKALQAMMNPHFIFNAINAIQNFINEGDKEAANRYLADFAKLIRMNSGFTGKSYILLEEELDYLLLYLSFEKLRFGKQLAYEVTTDPAIDKRITSLPVMMIQPFIENAIWHGILPCNKKGNLLVKIDKETSELLRIKVEDNGIGISMDYIDTNLLGKTVQRKNYCVAIQRLKIMEEQATRHLFIQYAHLFPELKDKGTVVEFVIPYYILKPLHE